MEILWSSSTDEIIINFLKAARSIYIPQRFLFQKLKQKDHELKEQNLFFLYISMRTAALSTRTSSLIPTGNTEDFESCNSRRVSAFHFN